MTCSTAQRDANVANSARSTGPRTEAGKAASRRNALKHGLSGEGKVLNPDDQAELERRVVVWAGQFPPANLREAWLVRQLALAALRIDRCAQLECALLDAHRRRDLARWDDDRDLAAEQLAMKLADDPVATVLRLRHTSHGCDWLSARWTALADGLENETCLWTEADAMLALNLLGTDPALRHLDPASRALVTLAERARGGDREAAGFLRERIAVELAKLEERAESLFENVEQPAQQRLLGGLQFDNEPDTRALRRLESAARRVYEQSLKELKSLHDGREKRAPIPAPQPAAPAPAPAPAPAREPSPRSRVMTELLAPPSSTYLDISASRPAPAPPPSGRTR